MTMMKIMMMIIIIIDIIIFIATPSTITIDIIT